MIGESPFWYGASASAALIFLVSGLLSLYWWTKEQASKPKKPAPRRKAARRTPKGWLDERRIRRERLREVLTDDTIEQEPIR